MTTLIPFQPNGKVLPPFQTTLMLDGQSVGAQAQWSMASQRWYLILIDSQGNRLWTGPMVGSSLDFDIPLAPGIFTTSTLIYRAPTGNLEVSP